MAGIYRNGLQNPANLLDLNNEDDDLVDDSDSDDEDEGRKSI